MKCIGLGIRVFAAWPLKVSAGISSGCTFIVLFMAWLAVPVSATPIVYTFSGTATGTAGSTSFSNAALVLVLVGDTSLIDNALAVNWGIWQNTVTGTITIQGVGTAVLSQPLNLHSACGTGRGFGVTLSRRVIGSGPPSAFLTSGIPLSYCSLGAADSISGLSAQTFPSAPAIPTGLGPIQFTSIASMSYVAAVGSAAQTTAVPTSSAGALVIVALMVLSAGAWAIARRQRTEANAAAREDVSAPSA